MVTLVTLEHFLINNPFNLFSSSFFFRNTLTKESNRESWGSENILLHLESSSPLLHNSHCANAPLKYLKCDPNEVQPQTLGPHRKRWVRWLKRGEGAPTALWNETDAIFREIRALREGRRIIAIAHFLPKTFPLSNLLWVGRPKTFETSVSSEILIEHILLCASACRDNGWILHWLAKVVHRTLKLKRKGAGTPLTPFSVTGVP